MRLSLKTPPAARALDWGAEVKGHLRLDAEDERQRVESILVPAAEQWAESATGRQLIHATWQMFLRTFPGDGCPIVLPKPPLSTVSHVKYYDADGVQQTWAASNYTVIAPTGPKAAAGRIQPNDGVSYPTIYGDPYEIEVELIAGYGADHTTVPAMLRAGMLLLVAEMFERRELAVTGTIIQGAPLQATSLILPFMWEG